MNKLFLQPQLNRYSYFYCFLFLLQFKAVETLKMCRVMFESVLAYFG